MTMMMGKSVPGGYLSIDHRESPGLGPGEGRIPGTTSMPTGRGMHFQADTRRCGHCPRQVILNPIRTRERTWCRGGDHYLCDVCALDYKLSGGVCRPFQKVIDDFVDAAAKGKI